MEKWPSDINPESSWWHRHTLIKVFWLLTVIPWTADTVHGTEGKLGAERKKTEKPSCPIQLC